MLDHCMAGINPLVATCKLISSPIIFRAHLIHSVLAHFIKKRLLDITYYIALATTSREVLFETLKKYISLVTLVNPKYTCDVLLYGDSRYKWHANKEIIKATIEFILLSKIFDKSFIQN